MVPNKHIRRSRRPKGALVALPFLAFTLLSFTTAEIGASNRGRVQGEAKIIEHRFTEQETEVRITKTTTEAELDDIAEMLKARYKVDFQYSGLKVNANNEITSITLSYRDKNGNNNNYTVQGMAPINTIVLKISEAGSVSMQSEMTEAQRLRREEMRERQSKRMEMRQRQRKETRQALDSLRDTPPRMEQMRQRTEARRRAIEERTATRMYNAGETDETDDSFQENEDQLLIVVDGNVRTQAELQELGANIIESVNVLKGKKAIKKYGDKGRNGVIEIVTKN